MALLITNTDNVSDDATLELDGAVRATTAIVGGTTYLFVSAQNDDGVSVFSVAGDGTLTNVDNVVDDGALELDGVFGLTTAVVGGTTYLFAAGSQDDGLSVFSVAADGTLTNVDNVSDDATLELDGAREVTTAVIGGTTYLFVTAGSDNGVSVFSVAVDGTLTNVDNVSDDATLELFGAQGATTAVVGVDTYLFVAGSNDSGVSVFRVAADGTLANVDNVDDAQDAALALDFATDAATAVIGGTTYLFVTSQGDDGVSVFSVAADGTLINVDNLNDAGALELAGAAGATTAEVGGITYLFVTGIADNGVSVFSIIDENPPPLGDVLWQHSNGTVATADHELGSASANWQIRGTGDFDGDGDDDILWRHTDGLTVIWELAGGDFLTNHNLGVVATTWQIAGTGDFDGDGDDDILWRHNEGQAVIWEMEDGEYVVNHNLGIIGTTWTVAGTGDFDGDGDADILWRHTDGQVVTWEMEDGEYVVNHNLGIVGTTWQIRGTGDFDGDGDSDILWHHSAGQVVTWEMEDGAYVVNHNLASVATTWQIACAHDFDSDGDADILWRHQEGQVVTWEMQAGALVQNNNIGAVSNAWQIRGTGKFDLA